MFVISGFTFDAVNLQVHVDCHDALLKVELNYTLKCGGLPAGGC